MDFNLKQWRNESEEDQEQEPPSPNLPKLLLNSHPSPSSALPLFFSEPNTNLSAYCSSDHPNTPSANKFPRMGSYFSLSQWQELELQALIFRHMIAGATIPNELLHLVKKSLINSPSSPYYLSNPLNQYYPHYQPALLQSGYWGKAAMDPEPGRCRRTDGKKWRCSRDVVAGMKYCERHMHRGRNRSRKPVEIPTSAAAPYGGGETMKNNHSVARQGVAAAGGGGSGSNPFTLTAPSQSTDLLHLNQRPTNSIIETKRPFEAQNDGQPSGRTLRHFIDDWPKPIHENENDAAHYSATNLSISMPEIENPSSDFSLKLGTGIGYDEPSSQTVERDNKPQLNWGMTWGNIPVAPMGGPLAEALRSSASNSSSPTSVLHRLPRGPVSEVTS
ncbi:hypothetical protein DH2020_014957 [Rehmannia glutinosa]|uniref:Growth-regulating factor n=1 Tax=Rehmannia glutinosa TaxID=99300 RepID=A0ABR0X130_REHGL